VGPGRERNKEKVKNYTEELTTGKGDSRNKSSTKKRSEHTKIGSDPKERNRCA